MQRYNSNKNLVYWGGVQRNISLISKDFQTITWATQFADGSNKGHGTTKSPIQWQRSTFACAWKYVIPTRQTYIWLVGLENTLFIWQYGASLKSGSLITFLPMCIYYIWTKWAVYKMVSYPNIFVLYESSGINVTVMAWIGWKI